MEIKKTVLLDSQGEGDKCDDCTLYVELLGSYEDEAEVIEAYVYNKTKDIIIQLDELPEDEQNRMEKLVERLAYDNAYEAYMSYQQLLADRWSD